MSHAKTTIPGYRNLHGQEVIARTGFPSSTFPGQTIYSLRCIHCNHTYGSNGCDIHKRLCPSHQNGAKGEPIPSELPPNLFHGESV
jgi:hypothetical protein